MPSWATSDHFLIVAVPWLVAFIHQGNEALCGLRQPKWSSKQGPGALPTFALITALTIFLASLVRWDNVDCSFLNQLPQAYLMHQPVARDLGSSSAMQHDVSHGVHTGLLLHF